MAKKIPAPRNPIAAALRSLSANTRPKIVPSRRRYLRRPRNSKQKED